MGLITEAFLSSWKLFSARARVTTWFYGISMLIAAILDSVGMWALSLSLTNWFANTTNATSKTYLPLAALALVLFLLKTILVGISSRVCFNRLVDEEVHLSEINFNRLMSLPYHEARTLNFSDFFDIFLQAPQVRVHTIVINAVTVISSALNIVLVLSAVFWIQPVTAIATVLYFSVFGYFQNVIISSRSRDLGLRKQLSFDQLQDDLNTALSLQKLLRLMQADSLLVRLKVSRHKSGKALVDLKFLQLVPRLSLEIGLLLGATVLGVASYLASSSESFSSAILIFLVAGFRIIPIISYIQSLLSTISAEAPYIEKEISRFANKALCRISPASRAVSTTDGRPRLILRDVSFRYPDSVHPTINQISASFESGKLHVIVGPPGSGKTSLMDLCMGLLVPDAGLITFENCRDQIGYVPQETGVFDGSIEQNIALTWDRRFIDRRRIEVLLSDLSDVSILREFINSDLNAKLLSGGQKQLVCFLRALYSNPAVLFLDEATSSLDNTTEKALNEILTIEKERRLIVMIAHRSTTIQNADQVLFINSGKVSGIGSPKQLQETNREYSHWLAGLDVS